MGLLSSLYTMKNNIKTKRISSYDKTGGNVDSMPVLSGTTGIMAEINTPGIIKHIWITISCKDEMIRRNAIIRMFWDDSNNPSVECPIGDFFGQGWGECYPLITLPLAAAPVHGRGLNCYFPMPFKKNARIEIENQSEHDIAALYYYVDYEEHESVPAGSGYFHAFWNREVTFPEGPMEDRENEHSFLGFVHCPNKTDKNNYLFADIKGKGQFIGVHYFVDTPTPIWYGEGDDMWMIDGEEWPGSLHGTGTEDFFNSAWCPNELYMHPYFGYAKIPNKLDFMGRTHCYRYFIEDPVYFEKSLKLSIEHGHCNVLTLDISSVAYWYQEEVHDAFRPLPEKDQRQNMPEIGSREIHIWRDAWRREMRGKGAKGILWGNESV